MFVVQHQGVKFLLGDCYSESKADIAIKVHGFHGEFLQNCSFVSHEKLTTGDQTSLEFIQISVPKMVKQCYVGKEWAKRPM